MSGRLIGTIDQGTTSTRFILFDPSGTIIASSQMEHRQIFPEPGRVEHDPVEILDNCKKVIRRTFQESGIDPKRLDSVGITNQRETIVAWNRKTGKPYHNAIVWQDMRGRTMIDSLLAAGHRELIHKRTGLIPAPYFSASKIHWLLDNVAEMKQDALKGDAVVGTIDSWLLWNLSGGGESAPHITDVTNASRMMLMDIESLMWDEQMLSLFDIPRSILPDIVPSIPNEPFATGQLDVSGSRVELAFSGILGDQQAALFGQACFNEGQSKCTYGTGCFLLMNTGNRPVVSRNGLLTTVAYQKEGQPPVYALEGAVAVAGSLVQWVRDNLGLISNADEINHYAMQVEDCGGVYFVPAFAGLFAPYWRPGARGVICGLTGYARKEHLCRAVLESTAFQVHDLFQAIGQDCDLELPSLRVDGGMTVSEPLMQVQADFLKVPVIRPEVIETTALGAAYAAGLSSGYWPDLASLENHWNEEKRWNPGISERERLERLASWKKAVERSYGWQ